MRNKLIVKTNPMEIRQLEKKTGKTGKEYFYIRVEDDKTGDAWELYDPNMEHMDWLKRKQIVIFTLEITEWDKQTNVKVLDFEVLNGEIKDEKENPATD